MPDTSPVLFPIEEHLCYDQLFLFIFHLEYVPTTPTPSTNMTCPPGDFVLPYIKFSYFCHLNFYSVIWIVEFLYFFVPQLIKLILICFILLCQLLRHTNPRYLFVTKGCSIKKRGFFGPKIEQLWKNARGWAQTFLDTCPQDFKMKQPLWYSV